MLLKLITRRQEHMIKKNRLELKEISFHFLQCLKAKMNIERMERKEEITNLTPLNIKQLFMLLGIPNLFQIKESTKESICVAQNHS